MGNQRKDKLFEQHDDVTKKVRLNVVEFYEKLNPTTFYFLFFIFIRLCRWKITLIGLQCLNIEKFVL